MELRERKKALKSTDFTGEVFLKNLEIFSSGYDAVKFLRGLPVFHETFRKITRY